jgi:hypothetical protein
MKLSLKTGFLIIVATLSLCAVPAASGGIDCQSECNQRLKEKTGICDAEFRSAGSAHQGNTKTHQACLAAAKNEYDACLAVCKGD